MTDRAGHEGAGVEIEVSGLVCRFGHGAAEHAALDGLDLRLPRGEVTAVVGPSGAGKSTLLRVVAGLTAPDAGDVRFDGASVLAVPPEKRRLGVVFQSYALFPHLTVADNVAFPLRVRGRGWREARRRTAGLLERLEIAPLAERHPHQLSGGERQRVALARALAAEPRALLLDEPLAALDARLRLALREDLALRLRAAGLTAVYVTHDREEAMVLGDRVAVLRGGRLEQVGRPETLYRSPATPFVATFFGEANLLPATFLPAPFVPAEWRPVAVAAEAASGEAEEGAAQPSPGWLEAPWGRLPVPSSLSVPPRDGAPVERRPVRLMLRPEAFRPVDGAAASRTGLLRGRVREATFLGGRRRLVVEVAGLPTPLQVDLPPSPPVSAGETLTLEPDLAAAALLPAAPTRGDER